MNPYEDPTPEQIPGQLSLTGERDGDTYNHDRDYARLNAQHLRVYEAMADADWHTLADVAAHTLDPEASISARLRDFRKPRFGGHTVDRRHVESGLWEYRLVWNPDVPRPTKVSA